MQNDQGEHIYKQRIYTHSVFGINGVMTFTTSNHSESHGFYDVKFTSCVVSDTVLFLEL